MDWIRKELRMLFWRWIQRQLNKHYRILAVPVIFICVLSSISKNLRRPLNWVFVFRFISNWWCCLPSLQKRFFAFHLPIYRWASVYPKSHCHSTLRFIWKVKQTVINSIFLSISLLSTTEFHFLLFYPFRIREKAWKEKSTDEAFVEIYFSCAKYRSLMSISKKAALS